MPHLCKYQLQQYTGPCNITGFPFQNTYSTILDIDKYSLTSTEKTRLMELREDVLNDPSFENLEKIFWEIIPQMHIGKIIEEVDPVGGEGKKESVLDIIKRFQFKGSDLMYVGDSITDVQPLKYALEQGGLSVAFNGNEYSIEETEIAIMADNTLPISILADLFNKGGREEIMEFIDQFKDGPLRALEDYPVDSQLTLKYPPINIQIDIVDDQNREKIKEESLKYRKNVRGESIGV